MKLNFRALKPQVAEVWKLSLSAILTQITTIAMQYIDSAMVGALGANASASIGLVSSSTWLLNGVTYLLGRTAAGVLNPVDPIARQALPAFHGWRLNPLYKLNEPAQKASVAGPF